MSSGNKEQQKYVNNFSLIYIFYIRLFILLYLLQVNNFWTIYCRFSSFIWFYENKIFSARRNLTRCSSEAVLSGEKERKKVERNVGFFYRGLNTNFDGNRRKITAFPYAINRISLKTVDFR